MSSLVACALVVSGSATATAAKRPSRSSGSPLGVASGSWGAGVEAVLPANAMPNGGAEVYSISCPSAGNCTAVGGYNAISGGGGLLLTETAGRWAAGVEAVLPADANPASRVSFGSVSCGSVGNCTAVGAYTDSSGNREALLLTETAGMWAAGVEAVLPADARTTGQHAELSSVSCASAGNCTAVGFYSPGHGLLLTETDGTWSAGVEAVLPADANPASSASVESVSCASAGNCTAVGGYTDSSGNDEGLMLTETAGSWAPGVEAALPADARTTGQFMKLSSVSCASAGNCTAVGVYDIADVIVGRDLSEERGKGLLLTESAGSWATGVEATLPATADGPDVVNPIFPPAVSCPSVGNCSAVGSYYYDTSSPGLHGLDGLLLTETAGSWYANAAGTGAPPPGFLNAVSCASPGNCGALVGDELLTETAGTWGTGVEPSLPTNAGPGSGIFLYSVSCGSAGDCTAVGYYDSSGRTGGLLIGGSPASVGLDISKVGAGSGTVSSVPAGIDCGPTCSASFGGGTLLTLTATASAGSRFSGWSGGGCKGSGSCQVDTGISEQTVTATFGLLLKCVVPKLRGKILKAAKHAIRTHHCTIGKIKHARSRIVTKGHVVSQRPKPGRRLKHGAKVNLVVSNGRR